MFLFQSFAIQSTKAIDIHILQIESSNEFTKTFLLNQPILFDFNTSSKICQLLLISSIY